MAKKIKQQENMKMKKVVKRWGSGLGVYFDHEDIKIYNLKEDKTIDLEFCIVKNERTNKKRN